MLPAEQSRPKAEIMLAAQTKKSQAEAWLEKIEAHEARLKELLSTLQTGNEVRRVEAHLAALAENKEVHLSVIGRQSRIIKTVTACENVPTLLAAAKPSEQIAKYGAMQLPEILANQKIKLSELKEAYGEFQANAFLTAYIYTAAKYLGSSSFDTEAQTFAATMLFGEIYYLSVSELAWVFYGIMKGKYGPIYGKLNPDFLAQAFRAYKSERNAALATADKERRDKEPLQGVGLDEMPPEKTANIRRLAQEGRINKLKRDVMNPLKPLPKPLESTNLE